MVQNIYNMKVFHKTFAIFIVLALSNTSSAWRHFLRGRAKNGLIVPYVQANMFLPGALWFDQRLDHSDPTNEKSWQQRYYVNSQYYKNSGPIFLLIGGEGEATAEWIVSGQWIEYAKRYNAFCFYLEHRFYGQSHPTSDMSLKNLKYLNSQQALTDIAYFIEGMKPLYQIPDTAKWILFGGSYPGSLAAWMRFKYPHLVQGAVSTSGPLLAQIDFEQYYVVVENALKTHSQACVDAVIAANNQIHIMLHHPIGQQNLYKQFRLCDPLDPGATKKKDISNLFETLAGNLAEVVQYNEDNRQNSNIMNYTISAVCNILENETNGIPVERLAIVSNSLLTANHEKCLDYKYSKMIDELRSVSWKSEVAKGARQWFYQTCTEFGFFQTSTARPKLFSETFPVDFFIQQCIDVFGPKYNLQFLENSVYRTNTLYGGMHLKETNVVYVHGSMDPWHPLGIIKSTDSQAPAIYINGTAHCANMYPDSPHDPPQLVAARQKISDLIGQWLKWRL